MYYVYVLLSKKDSKFYIGLTKDLKARFESHKNGCVKSTKERRPLKLIYYEAGLNKKDAEAEKNILKHIMVSNF